jgi:hypothetical protein
MLVVSAMLVCMEAGWWDLSILRGPFSGEGEMSSMSRLVGSKFVASAQFWTLANSNGLLTAACV